MKWFVFTRNPRGTTITCCPSEALAIELCVFAVESMQADFAFFSQ